MLLPTGKNYCRHNYLLKEKGEAQESNFVDERVQKLGIVKVLKAGKRQNWHTVNDDVCEVIRVLC